jgi:hypothetical protein
LVRRLLLRQNRQLPNQVLEQAKAEVAYRKRLLAELDGD